jgi:hypothetical protein
MLIAEQKRRENIAEYLIYMFEIEDIIRSFSLDMELIEKNIIQQYEVSNQVKENIRSWYTGLIGQMQYECIEEVGHLHFLLDIIDQMNELHQGSLNNTAETKYQEVYRSAEPNISDYRSKTGQADKSDVEICLEGLYALLMLKLQKKEISDPTLKALSTFGNLLAHLSLKFKEKGL